MKARPGQTKAHDFAFCRARIEGAAPEQIPRKVQIASIRCHPTIERSAPIYASPVRGRGDDSFIADLVPRNGDDPTGSIRRAVPREGFTALTTTPAFATSPDRGLSIMRLAARRRRAAKF